MTRTLPPGARFKKGQSGNPGGRPKGLRRGLNVMLELARAHTGEAIETLVEAMRTAKDPKVRCAAACALLDRGWGRPIATLQRTDYEMPPVALLPVEADDTAVNGESEEVDHGH
jgi:hypothetical protein